MIVARDLDGEIAEGGRNAPSAFENSSASSDQGRGMKALSVAIADVCKRSDGSERFPTRGIFKADRITDFVKQLREYVLNAIQRDSTDRSGIKRDRGPD